MLNDSYRLTERLVKTGGGAGASEASYFLPLERFRVAAVTAFRVLRAALVVALTALEVSLLAWREVLLATLEVLLATLLVVVFADFRTLVRPELFLLLLAGRIISAAVGLTPAVMSAAVRRAVSVSPAARSMTSPVMRDVRSIVSPATLSVLSTTPPPPRLRLSAM